MTADVNEALIWALESARRHTLTLAGDIPRDRACQQSVTGEHHPVWILGHLLLGDTYLLSLLNVEPLSEEFPILLSRYGPGASPLPLLDRYDALPTLVERLKLIGSRRLEAIRSMTGADLTRPTSDPGLARAQPTISHHLHGLVCHEGYHAGQLSAWRRAHGLGPKRWAFAPT